MQITHGIRGLLSRPGLYSFFQVIMGAREGMRFLATQYLRAKPHDKVLDIGCGPCDLLAQLTDVEYWGFDISPDYINHAKNRYGSRGNFQCKIFDEDDLRKIPKVDLVLLSGLMHHLDDREADTLLDLAAKALAPQGRLITVDPVLVPGQNPFARFLINNDRGQNVREKAGYEKLLRKHFRNLRIDVIHKAWIPYTRCYTECSNNN